MKNLLSITILVLANILSYPLFSSAQTDSTCNYNYITQQLDAYYDSIAANYDDSAIKVTGYKEYTRWKNHMYFREGKNGNLFAHEQYVQDYFEGIRNISENDGSDWKYFGPKGVPDSHSGTWHQPGANGKGMIISLYIYPDDHDKILAGSHNSGLWKSEDGGDTWHCLTDDNYKIRGVNSIVVDPENSSTILISSFNTLSNNSYGLFKSSDGGVTWSEMNNGLEINNTPVYPSTNKRSLPRKLILRPSDGSLFFITHSYVFKADSFADDWELIYYKLYTHWLYDKGFFDFEFDLQNDSILYLSGTDIFKSNDDGISWDNITLDVLGDTISQIRKRTEISVNENYPGKAWFNYAYYDTLTKSNKIKIVRYNPQGTPEYYTYPLETHNAAGAYSMEFEISPLEEDIFYFGAWYDLAYDASGDSTFRIATTGGGPENPNWLHVDIREMKIVKYDSVTYRMYIAHDGGVSWANCEGNTGSLWTWDYLPGDEEHGLDVFEFYDFTCLDDDNDLVYGGCQDLCGMSLKDNIWCQFGGGDGGEIVVDNRNADTTFVYYNTPGAGTGFLFRSTDFGETLIKMFSHDAGSLFTALSLDPFQEKMLYYASDKLYYWPDARHGFDPNITTGIENIEPLSDIEIIHDGGPGQVTYKYTSSQRYYGWSDSIIMPADYNSCFWKGTADLSAYLYGANYGYITDIETNPNNPSQIWIAFGKATKSDDPIKTKKIYYLDDDGAGSDTSWIPFVEGFPEGIPVRKLLYDHKYNRLYCASDIGVWVRDLNLEDHEWVEFNKNLPFKIVTDLEILYSQNKIRAATYGRGIWESPIYCYYDDSTYVVNGSEVWTDDKIMTSNIIIPDSAELTIVGCKVFMPTDSRISYV